VTLFRIFPTSLLVSLDVEDAPMKRPPDAPFLPHTGVGQGFPKVRAHRALLQASAVVRADACARIRDLLPPDLVPLVAYALAASAVSLHRDAAATYLGISRRTLHRRLVLAGWPAPRRFLTSLRLLVAAGLLDHGIPSLDRIAWHLGFSDGAVLGKALRQLAGVTVSDLRARGALSHCVARLYTCPDIGTDAAIPLRMVPSLPNDSPTR
jgi:AraC-like DNA-binding protein